MMNNKQFLRIIVLFSISLLLLIGLCVLGVLGIKQKMYYEQNYKYTMINIINFTISKETCSIYSDIFHMQSYKGYVNITYDANNIKYYSWFTKDEFCTPSYNDTMKNLKERYHVNQSFYIWYFMKNPYKWVFQLPKGEAYIVCSAFFIFFFLFSLFIGCIYIVRDKDYLFGSKRNENLHEILYF